MEAPTTATPPPARRLAPPGRGAPIVIGGVLLACALLLGLAGWAAHARTVAELGQAGRLAITSADGPHAPIAQADGWWHRVSDAGCAQTHLEAARQPVDIPAESTICGNVTVLGADVSIAGTVKGDVRVIGGSVSVQGHVTGSIYVVRGNVTLWPQAQVDGKVHVWSGEAHQMGRQVAPQTLLGPEFTLDAVQPFLGAGLPAWWQLVFWALFGCALALLFPTQIQAIEAGIVRAPLKSLVVGVVVTLLTLVLVGALAITLVGIPIALLALAIGWVGWALGTVAIGYALSHIVMGKRLNLPFVLSTLMGLVALVGLEQLPWIGWGVTLLFGCLGIGATFRWGAGQLLSRRR